MYEIVKQVIANKDYELASILKKIDTLWTEDKFSDEQRDELIAMARENANPQNSYAPLQEQIEKIALEVKVLREEVATLKNGGSVPEEDVTEEYPEYVQPTGAHDAYKIGDKMTFKGKKYESTIDGNVWTPEVNPRGWKLIEE